MVNIVIGSQYGDEGKGMVVDYLTRKSMEDSDHVTVIRFGGGPQCGHRVVHKNRQHIFSSFGSGTLRGAPTYWTKDCPINPISLINEYDVLKEKGIIPTLTADPECPIITPWDVFHNREIEKIRHHGTTGTGFGATISRNSGPHKLRLFELRNKAILEHKINTFFEKSLVDDKVIGDFYNSCIDIFDIINVMKEEDFFIDDSYRHSYIFEGNQGILLDHEYGFFPHVTHANTLSRGAKRIVDMIGFAGVPLVNYVSRAYSTRHGNGPFPGEEYEKYLYLQNMEGEANKNHEWQGKFRTAPLNLDMLRYAMDIDVRTRRFATQVPEKLFITCADHVFGAIPFIEHGGLYKRKSFDKEKFHNTTIVGSPTWSSEI